MWGYGSLHVFVSVCWWPMGCGRMETSTLHSSICSDPRQSTVVNIILEIYFHPLFITSTAVVKPPSKLPRKTAQALALIHSLLNGQSQIPGRSQLGIPLPNPPGFPPHESSPVPLLTCLTPSPTTLLCAFPSSCLRVSAPAVLSA